MSKQKDLQFLVYLAKIAYPRHNSHCFIIYMIVNYCDILKQQQIFTLRGVSPEFLTNFVRETLWDIDNTIVVNDNVERSCLKYIVVNNTSRKVNVITKKFDNKSVALLSYNLLYNLKGAITGSFKKCGCENLQFADEVELSLVNSACDWSHFVIDSCLKNFFDVPKLLYEGDLISIDLKKHGKEVFYQTNKITNINEKLHFKCNKIIYLGDNVEGGYLCSKKTTLKQATNIQSFIPNENLDLEKTLPSAFDTYFGDLRKAVLPFIKKNKSNFLPVFLLEGRRGSGKSLLIKCLASTLGMHLSTISNFDVTATTYAQNETKLRNSFFAAKMAAPSILQIRNFENFGKNNEGQYDERLISYFINEVKTLFESNSFPLILICCSSDKNIPIELRRTFLKTFEIKAPNDQEREKILNWILESKNITSGINMSQIANKTHGFLFEDLRTLIHYAETENNLEEKFIPRDNFLRALDLMQSNYSESLGAPRVPQVKWSDVGGLTEVKQEIIKTIKLPLRHPGLLKSTGLKRSGILLYGPPGTGKTLMAKAVATECGLCFLSVKGPELLNMYVGQSEQNVREVFEKARDASPCIIFFDELDSLAPNRGASGDSGGVMDRVVSQLLAEMDGLNQTGTVFIIGWQQLLITQGEKKKSCRDKLDKFYIILFVSVRQIKCTKKNFNSIVVIFFFLGTNDSSRGTPSDVIVSLDDFKCAIKTIKPSIRQEDLEYYNKLKSDLK
ncbi:peroxisome assembly factor 2 [Tribolium madens]|uniref:peroxisome assembly factor 2 n=1 Tax=Tribolium madens TaxID=41895 RepID=UPI001CF72E87|nr:peroxisome assembly factor 2 [Tribolium madens]